jgi:signal transduction histidine kinase
VVLWWIANAVLLLVVVPVVALLLHRLRQPVLEIRGYAEDALEHGVLAIAALDPIDDLVETRERVAVLKEQVAGYGASVARILS